MTVDVKNFFQSGDTLELICPSGNYTFTLDEITDKNGQATDTAPGSGHVVSIPLPENHGIDSEGGKALLMRYL